MEDHSRVRILLPVGLMRDGDICWFPLSGRNPRTSNVFLTLVPINILRCTVENKKKILLSMVI